MIANKTIGITQFKSIRNPNSKFPTRAPPLPNVNDNAAAITLKTKDKKIFTPLSKIPTAN